MPAMFSDDQLRAMRVPTLLLIEQGVSPVTNNHDLKLLRKMLALGGSNSV